MFLLQVGNIVYQRWVEDAADGLPIGDITREPDGTFVVRGRQGERYTIRPGDAGDDRTTLVRDAEAGLVVAPLREVVPQCVTAMREQYLDGLRAARRRVGGTRCERPAVAPPGGRVSGKQRGVRAESTLSEDDQDAAADAVAEYLRLAKKHTFAFAEAVERTGLTRADLSTPLLEMSVYSVVSDAWTLKDAYRVMWNL